MYIDELLHSYAQSTTTITGVAPRYVKVPNSAVDMNS